MYNLEGESMNGTIYAGEPSSEPAFRAMLRRMKKGFLPDWWSADKEEECVSIHAQALTHAQEKADIQETWSDPMMPMKLRMLGEKVFGSTPGAGGKATGAGMLQMQMQMETGRSGNVASHLDLGSMFSRR